jgi:hypothetical protein
MRPQTVKAIERTPGRKIGSGIRWKLRRGMSGPEFGRVTVWAVVPGNPSARVGQCVGPCRTFPSGGRGIDDSDVIWPSFTGHLLKGIVSAQTWGLERADAHIDRGG